MYIRSQNQVKTLFSERTALKKAGAKPASIYWARKLISA
jgi:hypothetical protein